MVGLYNGLYLTGFYRASEFRISDGVLGWVGVGEMGAEFVGAGGGGGRNGTVGWRGVRDVGKGNGDGNNDGNVTMSEMLETS